MITFNEIAVLTVFTLIMSLVLYMIYRSVKTGSKGFLYMLFWMLAYWIGNVIAFLLFLGGLEFYEPVRVYFLNLSMVFITFGLIILGKDLGVIKLKFSPEKAMKIMLFWTTVIFATLFMVYFQGFLNVGMFELIGRVHQLLIFAYAMVYMTLIVYRLRFALQWTLLYAGAWSVVGIILIRLATLMYGMELSYIQNVVFAVEICTILPGLLLMWKRMKGV